ncbi:hypothetical protein ABPG73_022914 [Tetrahymena malaccensis]
MSIKDIQISKSRYNQGNAIISKDWEQVRNKKFQEEDLLWNDSQININGIKEQEQLKIQQNTKVLSNQEANSQRQDSENCLQQKQVFSFKNSNSRRFQYFSKYSTKSRTKTIDLDISNMNESSRMNQTQEFMTSRDQRSCSQNNQPQTQTDSKYRNRTNSFESYKLFQKSIVLITKLKLRLRNYYKNFTDIYKSRLLNNDMRLMINDLSDSIEANESFLEILEKSCSKFLYYQNNFQEEEQSKKQVIDKLSTDLQESLKREQYKETILQIDFLLNKRLSLETLQDLALYIQEEFYLPNQRIKLDNQLSLIFIIQGEMEITNTQDQENKYNNYDKKKKLDAGQNFGLIEFITGIPSNHILKSSKFTQIIRIDRADFIKIIQQNDLEYQKFCELRDKIQFYSNFQDLNMKCSFCQSYFHQDINCEQFIINRKQINYKSRLNQSQTQKRVSHKRKKIRNSNPLYIQYIVSQQAQILVEDFKKQKQTDILEQLNITVSESDISDNSVTNQQYAHKQYQSQKDIDHIKTSQNSYQQKIENNLRKQSIFLINKQSFKDLDDQQKSQIAYPHEQQGIDKQNLNGFETFALNSFSAFNESQRVTFKDFDKGGICKEGTENNKLSEEGIDSLSALTPSKIQAFQATNKSVKNMSSKYLQRFSCFYDNQDNSQQENLKEEINKLIESFKLLNQTLLCPTNKNRKSSTFQFNKSQDIQENQLKYIKVFRSEFICYDFEQLKDYVNYFPQGNSKEVILRQKNQFKKKFKRTNISSQFQSKN